VRRAAAVLAKCAARRPEVVDLLVKSSDALAGLVGSLVSESPQTKPAAEEEPRVVTRGGHF
jgi:hypothetical protein